MSDIQLGTKPFAFNNTPFWLIASVAIVVSLYDESLFGPAIFGSLLLISIFHFKNLTPLIAFPTFIGINAQFMNTSFSVGHISMSWKALLLICVIIYLLNFIYSKERMKVSAVSPFFFIAWIAYLAFVSFNTHSFSSPVFAFLGLLIALSVASQLFVNINRDNGRYLLILVFFSVLFLVFVGYVELAIEKTFLLSKWAQEERFRYGIMRIGSTVADSNYLCSLLLPSLFIFNTSPFKKLFTPLIIYIVSFLIFLQIIITFSRTGLFILLLGTAFALLLRAKHKNVLILAVLPILFVAVKEMLTFLLTVDSNSNETRFIINGLAFDVFLNSPIFGVGLGNFQNMAESVVDSVVGNLDTMNTYMGILTSGGLIGLSFYLVYILLICIKSKQLSLGDRRLFLIGFFSYNLFIFTIDSIFIYFTWLFPSMLLALIQHSSPDKSGTQNCNAVAI